MDGLPRTFTDLVGCRLPLQLAPMGGGAGTPELAVAVCRAGGLGMVSASHLVPLTDQLRVLESAGATPAGVGFFGWELAHTEADLELAASRARVVDVFWGVPDTTVVELVHRNDALMLCQVGSLTEALAAVDSGCDAVVAQGVEAGGHVRGTTPLLALLDEVVAHVPVPVVAAGGIATSRRVREVLSAGASAVRVGTRLLATNESAAHPDYLAALVAARGSETELTTAFHLGWEDAPHRVLRSAIRAAAAAKGTNGAVGETAIGGQSWAVPRWSSQPPSTFCTGDIAAMAMYAGMSVDDVDDVAPAADIVARLFDLSPGAGDATASAGRTSP